MLKFIKMKVATFQVFRAAHRRLPPDHLGNEDEQLFYIPADIKIRNEDSVRGPNKLKFIAGLSW